MFVNIIVTCLCLPWPGMIMMSPMMIAAPNFAKSKSSVLMAMLFFIYPSVIFILLYLLGYSFFNTNPLRWAVVIFILGVLVALLYGLPRQLFNLLKGISNYDYFIKDNSVYFNGKEIKGADADSFTHFENRGYYSKDKKHVYYNTKKLVTADVATFRPLANDNTDCYWHDKNNAYYKWELISGADGASFVYLDHYYTMDKNNVFFEKELINEADKSTFYSLRDNVGRDAENIFVRAIRATNIKDFVTFQLVTINEELFGRDKDQIYALHYSTPFPLLPFPEADLETFEIVGDYYAKDKNKVFYYSYHIPEIRVLDANAKTFVLNWNPDLRTDATDGERYYRSGVLHVVEPHRSL